jgi:pimeloyl-ACP methyl ester carboxylesterase
VALLLDYHSNVALYPTWQRWLREHQPPTLIVWGANDAFFTEPGASAYLADLPNAQLHAFATGHFALEEHIADVAPLIASFLDKIASDTVDDHRSSSTAYAPSAPSPSRQR